MIRLEAHYRGSTFYQEQMAEAEKQGTEWLSVVEVIQERVVKEFGYPSKVGLSLLRSAWSTGKYREIAPWLRYNRAQPCPLSQGQVSSII